MCVEQQTHYSALKLGEHFVRQRRVESSATWISPFSRPKTIVCFFWFKLRQPGYGVAGPGNDHIFPALDYLDEFGELGFGFEDVDGCMVPA